MIHPTPDNVGLAVAALFALAVCHATITTPPVGDAFELWMRRFCAVGFGILLVVIIQRLIS